jgi:hypothetical protein
MFYDECRFHRKDAKRAKEQGAGHVFHFCNSSRNDEVVEKPGLSLITRSSLRALRLCGELIVA